MKIIKPFLCFLISLFMVLDLFAMQMSIFTHDKLLNTNYYIARFQALGLYSYISDSIVTDLGQIQRECNLPKNIFDNIFSKDNIGIKVANFTTGTINYMTYKTSSFPATDITSYSNEISKRIDDFLVSSKINLDVSTKTDINTIKAQTSAIVKNEVYLVNFEKLTNLSSFQKFRSYFYKLYSYEPMFISIFILLTVILAILEIKNLFKFINWFSYSLIAGGLLVCIPAAAMLHSNFMDRLALSSPKLLLIVGTILRDYLQSILNLSIYLTVAGVIVFAVNMIILRFIYNSKTIKA